MVHDIYENDPPNQKNPVTRFSEDYIAYCSEFTDSPEIFHRYAAYFLISCALGRRVHLVQGDYRLFANMWMVFLAPSGLYHKSSSLSTSERILDATFPGFVWPHEWSHEKLMQIFQNQPSGTFIFDEISAFLSHLDKKYTGGTRGLLTSLYDCNKSYRASYGTEKERNTIVPPTFINIAGSSTYSWLKSSCSQESLEGGLLPRFLYIPGEERKGLMAFQPPHDMMKRNQLVAKLAGLSGFDGEIEMTYSPEAIKEHERFYENFANLPGMENEKISPFIQRLVPYAHKLAILISFDKGTIPVITASAYSEARLMVEHLAERLNSLLLGELGLSKQEANVKKVDDFLRSAHRQVKKSELMRKFHVQAREMDEILRTLRDSELIEISGNIPLLITHTNSTP